MRNFLAGVSAASILWLAAVGVMWIDWQKEKMEIVSRESKENYELRLEIAKINKVGKQRAIVLVKGCRYR